MRRRMVYVLLFAMILPALGLRGAAVSETGSIRVTLEWEGETVTGGAVTLYKVGEPISDGYRLGQTFGGGLVKAEDAHSPALAQWLAEQVGEGGMPRILDADGSAEFSRLEEGLYFLVQTETAKGYYPMKGFAVTLPYEGQWHVEAMPKLERLSAVAPPTGQHPAPILSAMVLVFSGVALLVCLDRMTRK